MGDTNATRDKNRTGNIGYTNLGMAYKIKTLILFLIGILTVVYADTFEMTIIGALTTLSGIGFDLVIVSNSNCGPRQKWPMKMAKIGSHIIVFVCFFIIVYFLTKDSETVKSIRNYYLSTTGKYAYVGCLIIKVIIILFSLIGPMTEYFYNKPNDNCDDEEEE